MSVYSIGNDLYSGRKSFNVIGLRKIWFGIIILAILASITSVFVKEPNLGIEFRGGSQFTVSNTKIDSHDGAYKVIAQVGKDDAPRVSSLGSNSIRVQTTSLDDQSTQKVKEELAKAYQVPEKEVTSTFIGPSWGKDIMDKAIRAMIVFLVAVSIVLIAYFRSWTIAVGAIGALLHDFVVTLGIYWILGLEITPATIIGILTILGYSLYDTVVVFDKVRENTLELRKQRKITYEESANLAINQTLIRSINTSITGLLPVMAVLFIGVGIFGAETLRDLALVMFVGMLLSTLSSIFIAAPLAVALALRNDDIAAHTRSVLASRGELGHETSKDLESVDGASEESDMITGAHLDDRVAGQHKGNSAQPKKRKKRNR
ncbi:protein translocase subunit SecF [Arcanobacterium bovis]|uniref:Protein-export membrane protein SecF n=1 Tax=Arcanobacterium bovis TaxID=2529275 RepID=A0A4Q9V1B5_9ACTO|nr:protein translocase subunit SecF [Arcanobacterium bovis]TBW22884.1 protein translocase subunit SecF [Arcanobacterium bovis]